MGADETEAVIGYRWHGDDDNWWETIRLSGHYERLNASEGFMLEEENVLRLGFGGHLQSWFQVALVDKREYWEGVYYDKEVIRLYAEARPVGPFWFSGLIVTGDEIDYSNNQAGEEFTVEPSLSWDLSRRLMLRLDGFYSKLDTPEGDDIYTANIADVRLTWQFNLRSFLRVTTQFTDIERNQAQYIDIVDTRERDVGRQLLYSYKLNPQTVFFLGYSDQYIDDDSLDGLTASDRTWFMKIGYAWIP